MSDKFIGNVFANTKNTFSKIKAVRVNLNDSALKTIKIFYPFKKVRWYISVSQIKRGKNGITEFISTVLQRVKET